MQPAASQDFKLVAELTWLVPPCCHLNWIKFCIAWSVLVPPKSLISCLNLIVRKNENKALQCHPNRCFFENSSQSLLLLRFSFWQFFFYHGNPSWTSASRRSIRSLNIMRVWPVSLAWVRAWDTGVLHMMWRMTPQRLRSQPSLPHLQNRYYRRPKGKAKVQWIWQLQLGSRP